MKRLRALDRRIIRNWLPLAFVASVLFASIYGAGQYILRADANDTQIQIAEDVASQLSNGSSTPQTYSFPQKADIASSLATFIVIYDKDGKSLSSSGALNGKDPQLPQGVFTYTAKHTEDRVTWQPASNVREAAVIHSYKTPSGDTGFVLASRSLREVEKRENELMIMLAIAWAIALAGSLLLRLILTESK